MAQHPRTVSVATFATAAACERCGCTEERACAGGCAWDPIYVALGRLICTECARPTFSAEPVIAVDATGDFVPRTPARAQLFVRMRDARGRWTTRALLGGAPGYVEALAGRMNAVHRQFYP